MLAAPMMVILHVSPLNECAPPPESGEPRWV